MSEKNKKSTFGRKMYLFVVLIILVVALGIVAMSYFVNVNQIDSYFKQLSKNSAENFASLVDGDYLAKLKEVLEREEYQTLRDKAEEAEDEAPAIEYLKKAGVYDKYVETRDFLDKYLRNMKDIKYLYIIKLFEPGSLHDMYLMDDYDNFVYTSGYYEEREPELRDLDPTKEIEPTISNGDWGWLCSAYAPVYDSSGKLVCHIGCDVSMDDVMAERYQLLLYIGAGALILIIMVVIGAIVFTRKVVIRPKEQRDAELGVAARMQGDLLPKNFAIDERIELFASMTPAKETGGDFYDFFKIDDDHIGIVMADVSGKGVPAAMFMVVAKALLKVRTATQHDPASVLTDVNNTLCADNPSNLFVTAWFGVLTLSTGELVSSNAGHEYPVLMRANGDYEVVQAGDNMPPLAAMEDLEFIDKTITLQSGDRLFLYTDGVPEAKSKGGTRFGMDRMMYILNTNKSLAPEDLLKKVKEEIDNFALTDDPFDDITMMNIIYK